MLENVHTRQELLGFARQKRKSDVYKTIHIADLESAKNEGWNVVKQTKKSARLSKPKPKTNLLEDRVWTLLYRMGFQLLSGQGGASVASSSDGPKTQIDCVAVDDEVAIAVECKTFQQARKDPKFAEKLGKFGAIRKNFSDAVHQPFPQARRRHVATIIFTWDFIVSPADKARAEEQQIVLLDERDLEYYEELVAHLGPASRYQFLADALPLKQIRGLEIRVPALQTRVGGFTYYTFSIQPEYLLKICFVSHRGKGRATDIDAYQRMISKARLKKISRYITEDGIFPTNIVLNLEKSKYARFDFGKKEGSSQGANVGWLTLAPAYKSAWIIDGQHRLFAYSGNQRASTSYLNVVAFQGLGGDMQAKLFVDINHEQKSVKRSLLDELWAELHWNAENDEKRVRAIISKAVQGLNEDKESPLNGRILLSNKGKTQECCISLSSVLGALDKSGFYLSRPRKNVVEHGPLWAGNNDAIMKRTIALLNGWFSPIAKKAGEWWSLGAGEGGGLAMNDGVTICINVLRSVIEHLEKTHRLETLEDFELIEVTIPFADALGDYLGSLTTQERAEFRALRGVQGQTAGTKMCQQAIKNILPAFDPPGLREYIERAKSDTNEKARKIIDRIEKTLQDAVLSVLKETFNEAPTQWWFTGVPKNVRKRVDEKINESDGKAGDREQNFELIHYREIIVSNWSLFEDLLAYGTGNKEKRTSWINEVNLMRNSVMHPSRREYLSPEKLTRLEDYDVWLQRQVLGEENISE
jgi:DNA sulfur modification protein DndB